MFAFLLSARNQLPWQHLGWFLAARSNN